MKNQVHYYVSSYLLCSFTYLEIATLSLVDASSSVSNGSTPLNTVESSKHEMGEELRNTKSQGHSKLPNFEGEFQVLESTKLTSTGSKKRAKRATKSQKKGTNLKKTKSEVSSKVSKKKKSKTRKSNAANENSEEEDFNLSNMESDGDILRKATERTSTIIDDYEWDSEDDWDHVLEQAEKEKRLPFDLKLSDGEISQTEPTNKKSSTQTTTRRSQSKTTHSSSSLHQTSETKKTAKKSSRNSTVSQANKNKTSKSTQKALALTTRVTTPEPDLRGFESASVIEAESASVVEAESASVIEYEDGDPEDYSLTYVSLDDEDEDAEMAEEYDGDTNEDESDYTYDEDHSAEDVSGDYIDFEDDGSIQDESESPEIQKPDTGSKKRKKKLKEKKKWIKEQKRDRKMEKQKRKKQSMDGMRTNPDEPRMRRRRPGRKKGDQSRATRLGIRRKMSGRHYGRNAGKEFYWSNNGRKVYKGPRRKFGLRGKAKINARIYKPPKNARRG